MVMSEIDASQRTSLRNLNENYPYVSSIASSASSSVSSVFSLDVASSQSSAPSSTKSALHSGWELDSSRYYADSSIASLHPSAASQQTSGVVAKLNVLPETSTGIAVAPELRQHPRRTQPTVQVISRDGSSAAAARPPPPLVRQCDRKENFVDSLIDATTQMIEVIWPTSIIPCGRDTVLGGKNLIGLRTFVQEVLKRSKTSYSTLQIALYYLVLIKPYIPTRDFTMEQFDDSHASRAMQCGRRMFLAALILASKYLQDRNYSARAWSKISGLKVSEINTNELAFVKAIGWRLHVPEPLFHRWTDVVFKFSPSAQGPPPSAAGVPIRSNSWKSIIPRLTPQLDELDDANIPRNPLVDTIYGPQPQPRSVPTSSLLMSPPNFLSSRSSPSSSADDKTPTIPCVKPQIMEPMPLKTNEKLPKFPPISPTIAPLPTPQVTPQTGNFSTPAVGSSGWGVRNSMSGAMRQAQKICLARTTLDPWPPTACADSFAKQFPANNRRSSVAPSSSSVSSPESMVSDVTSRSSRSSSISSVTSSAGALPPARLAVQATRRCANMQLLGIKENPQLIIRSSPDAGQAWDSLTSSPASYTAGAQESYIRESQIRAQVVPGASDHPIANISDQEAAEGLRDLALSHHHHQQRTLPPLSTLQNPLGSTTRKRERPSSISDGSLQRSIRDLIGPNNKDSYGGIDHIGEDDSTVLCDRNIATSFMLHNDSDMLFDLITSTHSTVPCQNASRKRACFKEDHGRTLSSRADMLPLSGPGVWAGLL